MSADRGSQYKEWILNVIDQLRSRKARPDLDRICHFVERKHGLARAVTESQVEKLVDQGVVIKVVYKRGTSYRNATKTRKRGFSNVQNSNIASRKITEALYSILKQRKRKQRQGYKSSSDRLDSVLTDESHQGASEDEHSDDCFEGDPYESEEGVSAREIETWLSDDDGEPFMCPISLVIQREVDAGRLIQLENGNYMPAMGSPAKPAKPDEKPAIEAVNVPQTLPERPVLQKSVSVVAKRGRPPKRKLPMGRSFSCNDAAAAVTPATTSSMTSPEAQVAPIPVMPPHLCDFCQLSARCNRRGQEEELLFCKDCNAKAHPSCMQYSPELAKRAQNTAWQCIDCKTCCICFDPGEADCMLFCDACDKGYHMQCHEPEVDEKPQGKWICTECVNDGVDIDEIEENNNVVDSTVRSTDTESVTTSHAESSKNSKYARDNGTPTKQAKTNEVYPNASGWAISDVVNFFQQKGFTEQAIAFKEQEIDGQSLLLLKRSDVLQGLSLKLGPALKMYNYVMKLQTAGQSFS